MKIKTIIADRISNMAYIHEVRKTSFKKIYDMQPPELKSKSKAERQFAILKDIIKAGKYKKKNYNRQHRSYTVTDVIEEVFDWLGSIFTMTD